MALDLFVVLIYAAGMLGLGWYGMRKAKTHEDYLVAGRNLGPSLYMGTMAATVLGGASTVGTVKLGYVYGISGFWLCAALGLGIIALNLFLAKPLLRLKIFTVTQVLEQRYNPMARQASAVIMLAYALMIAVTSTLAMGTVLQVLFELPFWTAILLGGGVVVVYSTVGGMWSLTLTDIVQFVIKTVGLMFVLLPICLYRVGGWDELVAKLPASSFSLTTIGWDTIITYFLIYFFGILIGQDIWQRVFTARDEKVAKRAGTTAGIYCVIYGLVCATIGMAAHVLLPDLSNANNAFAAIVKSALPDGIRGLVIAAALAAMMSTASAGLLAASTVLTEDLLPKLRGGKQSSLAINRLFTCLTGIAVLGIALVVEDVISALTLAYNLLVGGMLVPLIGAIYWKRATTAGAITSMTLGFVTALAFMIKDGMDANTPIYYSLSVALISFVVVSVMSRRPAGAVNLA
ncbi:sodium:solute symporter [Pseudomonas sp. P66]|jgi:SSS family solute:Na+ symporter|uniref:Sodium:solute symporter n=1 Tax=Pseudomonas arcuscaelestis TaxID=2710591 RepID=A0ABS2C3R2_9PSED|nr:sodium:solute symporter [Pseudomonas arcuscaelestis]MBM3109151.1 sodium:solute symporter [Pseudomonas arcuscaelestis]MBM5459968.1 sodium:solute symporter [Pseudomonas arcuscaelestis]